MPKNRRVEISGDVVVKSYDDWDWFIREKRAYSRLAELGGGCTPSGWEIRTPEVLCVDDTRLSISMRLVPGRSLYDTLSSKGDVDWRALGEALCAIHERLNETSSCEVVYADIGLGNVLFCPEERVIGFIDPGVEFGEHAHLSQDLLMVLWTISTTRLRNAQLIWFAERDFLNGYSSASYSERTRAAPKRLRQGYGMHGVYGRLISRSRRKGMVRTALFMTAFAFWKRAIMLKIGSVEGDSRLHQRSVPRTVTSVDEATPDEQMGR